MTLWLFFFLGWLTGPQGVIAFFNSWRVDTLHDDHSKNLAERSLVLLLVSKNYPEMEFIETFFSGNFIIVGEVDFCFVFPPEFEEQPSVFMSFVGVHDPETWYDISTGIPRGHIFSAISG